MTLVNDAQLHQRLSASAVLRVADRVGVRARCTVVCSRVVRSRQRPHTTVHINVVDVRSDHQALPVLSFCELAKKLRHAAWPVVARQTSL